MIVESEFCMEGCEEKARAREAEEFPLLETVARERPVKAQQARRRLNRYCDDL
jgi:hypothetical protein